MDNYLSSPSSARSASAASEKSKRPEVPSSDRNLPATASDGVESLQSAAATSSSPPPASAEAVVPVPVLPHQRNAVPDDPGKRRRAGRRARLTDEQIECLDHPDAAEISDLGRLAIRLYDGEELTIPEIAVRSGGRLKNHGRGFAKHYHLARDRLELVWRSTRMGPHPSSELVASEGQPSSAPEGGPSAGPSLPLHPPPPPASSESGFGSAATGLAPAAPPLHAPLAPSSNAPMSETAPLGRIDAVESPFSLPNAATSASTRPARTTATTTTATSGSTPVTQASKPHRRKKGRNAKATPRQSTPGPSDEAEVTWAETTHAAEIEAENAHCRENPATFPNAAFRDPVTFKGIAALTANPSAAEAILQAAAKPFVPPSKERQEEILKAHGGWNGLMHARKDMKKTVAAAVETKMEKIAKIDEQLREKKKKMEEISRLIARNDEMKREKLERKEMKRKMALEAKMKEEISAKDDTNTTGDEDAKMSGGNA